MQILRSDEEEIQRFLTYGQELFMEYPYPRERAIANATRENITVGFHESNHYGTAYGCGCIYYHPSVNGEVNFAIQLHEPCEKHKRSKL